MPFHSASFALLCVMTLLLYYRGGARWQHGVLLAASLVFYLYAGWVDTLLLLTTVGVNYLAAFGVAARAPVSSLVIPLGISFYIFQLIA